MLKLSNERRLAEKERWERLGATVGVSEWDMKVDSNAVPVVVVTEGEKHEVNKEEVAKDGEIIKAPLVPELSVSPSPETTTTST